MSARGGPARSLWVLALVAGSAAAGEVLFTDDFESGLDKWRLLAPDSASIRREPGTDNRMLELTPQTGGFSHALIRNWPYRGSFRMEGRLRFPSEGDGYLGLIYDYVEHGDRTDFGCLYVKSNGSYLRASPHYDGNPSWRLHEEYRVDFVGPERLQTGTWYRFTLDVHGTAASLAIGKRPPLAFEAALPGVGTFGLEARPGRGEPVWVDDVSIRRLAPRPPPLPRKVSGPLGRWQYYGPVDPAQDDWPGMPRTGDGWRDGVVIDHRGAVITGALTRFRSGEQTRLYLRARFDGGDTPAGGWLAVSSANRLDVWLNGHFLGVVEPEELIWSDHATNPAHRGARLPIRSVPGLNEIVLRVDGDRFAGGGFFIERLPAGDGRQPDAR